MYLTIFAAASTNVPAFSCTSRQHLSLLAPSRGDNGHSDCVIAMGIRASSSAQEKIVETLLMVSFYSIGLEGSVRMLRRRELRITHPLLLVTEKIHSIDRWKRWRDIGSQAGRIDDGGWGMGDGGWRM